MQFSDIPRQRCSKCSRQNMGLWKPTGLCGPSTWLP
jgi:hypothetical protein